METTNGQTQAGAQLESISIMVKRLLHSSKCTGNECTLSDSEILEGLGYYKTDTPTKDEINEYHNHDLAVQAIYEDPLSIEIRSDWTAPSDKLHPEQYRILLCWGGPAVQIVGELNEYNEPITAIIQHQDWGTPWTDVKIDDEMSEGLLIYSRCFYFGN